MKKLLYGIAGLAIGFFVASAFFMPELKAQEWASSSGMSEAAMSNTIPSSYGSLVAVSGIDMYFQAADGTVRIVKPKTATEVDSNVKVFKRG